jgi:uncharacterized OB-fold protein
MSEPIHRIKAPVRLEYTVTAGVVLSRFLAGVVEGRLLGRRCPSCTKVYVPPKGACPMCGVPCIEAPADEVRMGMRVKAEWVPPAERKPTLESIRWFVPTGEPDATYESYKEHL